MKTLIAIPVYNEERHVTDVLSKVRQFHRDILVIDDGSTDTTPLLLARLPVEVVRHAENRGYGRSLIDAFRWATCQALGYDWLVTMDCDEQHEPASLPTFFEAIAGDQADVVSGTRYTTSRQPRSDSSGGDLPPPDRRKINLAITTLINERLGLSLTDAFCGFKAYRVEALRRLKLTEPGYAFPMQFWVQAAARRLRIAEVPVRLIYNDPKRSFGGLLDDPERRLRHYQQVFERELAKFPDKFAATAAVGAACAGAEPAGPCG